MGVAMITLSLSLTTALIIHKTTLSSWMALVLILTFSSGMMTLFLYSASLSPNETKASKSVSYFTTVALMLVILMTPKIKVSMEPTMKMFSNNKTILLLTMVLLVTILALSSSGYHPNQTLKSSF